MKSRVQRVHFTGIGGIGMSGIAELLHNQGFAVQGTDAAESSNVQRLRGLGIVVHIGHRAETIASADVVVVTSAVKEDNPEVLAAQQRGIPVIPRAEMLAELMRMKQGIAIAGSHGKTTITSMIAHGMEVAGLDPTYVIGGRLTASGSNARLGSSPWLVAEADESDGSFLRLSPMISVVSNIDPEHLDHYGDFPHLLEAFEQFVNRTPFYGRVILHHEHPHVAAIRARVHRPVTTYGCSPQADLYLSDSTVEGASQRLHIVSHAQAHIAEESFSFRLPMPGRHNAENALAAIAVLRDIGISTADICRGMESFGGIQRRFQCTISPEQGMLVDDYGHHPKEVTATLQAARECWPDRIISVIFQPHRYTRTRDLMNEFSGAFDLADEAHVLPIYAASEEPIEGIDHEHLVRAMQLCGHRQAQCCEDMAAAERIALAQLAEGHVVMLLGAGSIGALAVQLRQQWEPEL
ncbi:MAG: UDP-N-acetylmuramate--L-alanine ligase [Mariprofundaceae bacterium]|nr:UDP-N-acetylmuramate--L-alanine ligase [Mariprofundaceae bacterium]